jgi:hypothetical protein
MTLPAEGEMLASFSSRREYPMATLSPRARRLDDEVELAIHERNARHIVALVEAWGLVREQRALADDDVRLHFDGLDRVDARTVADVWAHR